MPSLAVGAMVGRYSPHRVCPSSSEEVLGFTVTAESALVAAEPAATGTLITATMDALEHWQFFFVHVIRLPLRR